MLKITRRNNEVKIDYYSVYSKLLIKTVKYSFKSKEIAQSVKDSLMQLRFDCDFNELKKLANIAAKRRA